MKLSADLCDKMVARYKSGRGYETISKALNVPRSTVASVIVKWQQCGTTRALSGFYTVQPNWVRARTMTKKSAASQKTLSKMHKKNCSLDSKTQFNRNLNSGSVLLLELKVALLTSWASVLPWRLTAAYYSRSACILVLNQWVVNNKGVPGRCTRRGRSETQPVDGEEAGKMILLMVMKDEKPTQVIQQPRMKEGPAGRRCLLFIIIPLEATGVWIWENNRSIQMDLFPLWSIIASSRAKYLLMSVCNSAVCFHYVHHHHLLLFFFWWL